MCHREKSFGVGRSLGNDLATSLIDSENTPAPTACETPPLVTIALIDAPQSKGRARILLSDGRFAHCEIKVCKRPDIGDIAKARSDALNGVVLRDDRANHAGCESGSKRPVLVTVRAAR